MEEKTNGPWPGVIALLNLLIVVGILIGLIACEVSTGIPNFSGNCSKTCDQLCDEAAERCEHPWIGTPGTFTSSGCAKGPPPGYCPISCTGDCPPIGGDGGDFEQQLDDNCGGGGF